MISIQASQSALAASIGISVPSAICQNIVLPVLSSALQKTFFTTLSRPCEGSRSLDASHTTKRREVLVAQKHRSLYQRALAKSGNYLRPTSIYAIPRNEYSSPAAASSASEKPPKKMIAMDGNTAAATIAYACNEVSFIYPITPSSTMGELVDIWASDGRKNIYDRVLQVTEMESETGVAGAIHGALSAGSLATTFTASQGLLLMIPNMYKISGELLPCVMHVAARALAGQALSIFGDHSDVMAARQAGWAMLCSHSVQEALDLALVSQLATFKTSIPFVHYFDGFRTSHEVSKIEMIDNKDIKDLMSLIEPEIQKHRERALNPGHPVQKGTAQGPEIFFQMQEAANKYYDSIPGAVEAMMEAVAKVTGRRYHLFDYTGAPDAERVIIIMGSGGPVVEEAVNFLQKKGEKVGVLKVRLYRPWDAKAFLSGLPKTTKKIAVLDRTKESGSFGEPLYLDVCSTLMDAGSNIKVIGGRFGLASKEFTPTMAAAVFDNLSAKTPLNHFTVGIYDDVTFKSLPLGKEIDTVPEGTTQCLFWGMGSDGTVGANKDAVKIIADNTPLYAQAYFAYDAHKSGGVTVSHLRFGPKPITSQYLVHEADYLAVHNESYIHKYDFLTSLKPGGALVLNASFDVTEVETQIPDHVKRRLAELKPRLYLIDANSIAESVGLGRRINMVMQAVFFYLSGVMPFEKSVELLKKAIHKTYSKKSPEIVEMNIKAVEKSIANLKKVEIPSKWAELSPAAPSYRVAGASDFVNTVVLPMMHMDGDNLPVSAMVPGGVMEAGTTKYEKRAIASKVPIWKADNCTQCNTCSFVCPHAAIRPGLATFEELNISGPIKFVTRKAKGMPSGASDYEYRIQVSPYDCTGCELCTKACPDNALEMKDVKEVLEVESENWDFLQTLPNRGDIFDKTTVRGSQFQRPLMEFSGACEGCGETPYVKLLTQLFGDRMIIANATGCSSIWGGSSPANPYTTNTEGRGPAWANSLFEDNAQFGYGIWMATVARRKALQTYIEGIVKDTAIPLSSALRENLNKWLELKDDSTKCGAISKRIERLLVCEKDEHPAIAQLYAQKDLFPKIAQFIIGGDGWAYDIGYGGLDHVLASGEKVNILVLDTEMYSNTGGQRSKATPTGAVQLFAQSGQRRQKKDLGMLAMQYPDVYVASVALGANQSQVIRAFVEAEAHPGTSLVIAYAPCQLQGLRSGMSTALSESKLAVESGYWPLYRFNPALGDHGFQLDSKTIKGDISALLSRENRFNQLMRKSPETAKFLQHELQDQVTHRMDKFRHMANPDAPSSTASAAAATSSLPSSAPKELVILYGSETGNSQGLAEALAEKSKKAGISVKCMPADEYDVDAALPTTKDLVVVLSTCGQGDFPGNFKKFWEKLSTKRPAHFLKNTRYTVFGLGDRNYEAFCETAKMVDARLKELGASKVLERGVGDDQDEGKFDAGFNKWLPQLWSTWGLDGSKPAPGASTVAAPGASTVAAMVHENPRIATVYDQFLSKSLEDRAKVLQTKSPSSQPHA